MFQNEKIIETKTCKHCNSNFEITDKDLEFYEKVSPVFTGKKYNIPPPTLCPDCRQQRRLSFRNERKLYKRKCDATGKDIVSTYSPDKPYKVYNQDYWWSDKWEPMDYGKDFDFNRGFFEQFDELMKKMPCVNLSNTGNENSDYVNFFIQSKSCYFCFGGGFCEDIYYSSMPFNCKNSQELFFCNGCENCYETSHCKSCYGLMFGDNCQDCFNSYFLDSCFGCKNCFCCYGLNNKEYFIFNKKSSKLEFEKLKNELVTDYKKVKSLIDEFYRNTPILYSHKINSENCIGDYIIDSINCFDSFNIDLSENIKYTRDAISGVKYVYDSYSVGANIEMIYESMTCSLGLYKILFGFMVRPDCNNIIYGLAISSSSNLFGCIGLKNKQYCILNKQYTKEQYEIIVPKIIEHMQKTGEWGEFFPSSISPFGYNETVANEYFPLEKKEALKQNFNWSDYEAQFQKVDKIIKASMLPDDISKIPDDILNRAIECEVTKKPFRIIAQELEFYRKHNLPIPKRHPDQRHLDRMSLRNPRKLFTRICDKCKKDIKTTYSPERPEIVYCEECYNREIY